jgi:type I restriction enzyme, R subunit
MRVSMSCLWVRYRLTAGFRAFVRTLVGLDRRAAKHAFAEFNRKLTADQLESQRPPTPARALALDHLTARGVMDPKLLMGYRSPISTRRASKACSTTLTWSEW